MADQEAKERPILFSAPMVRALLAGTKKQTRRIVKPQPLAGWDRHCWFNAPLYGWTDEPSPTRNWHTVRCPYGVPGDTLWVKETWRPVRVLAPWDLEVIYAADGEHRLIRDGEFGERDWTMPKAAARGNVSPLFMPRWASRISLKIIDVRVERLNDISAEDADAECFGGDFPDTVLPEVFPYREGGWGHLSIPECYARLWEHINGVGSWAANPWVWVVAFEVASERSEESSPRQVERDSSRDEPIDIVLQSDTRNDR